MMPAKLPGNPWSSPCSTTHREWLPRACCWPGRERRRSSTPRPHANWPAAAARLLKSKVGEEDRLRAGPGAGRNAAVEGAILGDFEPDRYSTGNDKKSLESFAVVAAGESAGLEAAAERGRILAEAQNFARELVNEPANRLTPLQMAEAARNMAAEYQLECEVLDRDRDGKAGHGRAAGRGAGQRRTAGADRDPLPPGGGGEQGASGSGGQGRHVRHRRHFHQAGRRHGEDEVRHGRRRGHDRRHAGHRATEAGDPRHGA